MYGFQAIFIVLFTVAIFIGFIFMEDRYDNVQEHLAKVQAENTLLQRDLRYVAQPCGVKHAR